MSNPDPPEVVELFNTIEILLAKASSYDGVIVRSVGTKYANEDDFLSGRGAAQFGGRWNRPGILAIYGATDILTAILEAYQSFIASGFSLSNLFFLTNFLPEARSKSLANLPCRHTRQIGQQNNLQNCMNYCLPCPVSEGIIL